MIHSPKQYTNSIRKHLRIFVFFMISITNTHAEKVLNLYIWAAEIPAPIIHAFEKETGIAVHIATYENNESMYTKLKSTKNNQYDIILPSGYYVERMMRMKMLSPLDHKQLPHRHNLNQFFARTAFDKNNHYSIPLVWGSTGIFTNRTWIKNAPTRWSELWSPTFHDQLMLLDDAREIFAIALMTIGFDPNDNNPQHIKAAYQKLLTLIPNIKLFASSSTQATMIDEDAIIGSAWNSEVLKAARENKAIHYIYPKEGFIIWTDCLAIPRNAPHLHEAHQFIDYMLRARSAAAITLNEGLAVTNEAAQHLLPSDIRRNPLIYPPPEILERGILQRDVNEATLALYNHYWEALKLAF